MLSIEQINNLEKENNGFKKVLGEIKTILEQKLDVKLIRRNGNCPMIYNADFYNKIQQPILNKIAEVLK